MSEPASTGSPIGGLRQAGAAAVRATARTAARAALRRGGAHVARLDRRPRSRRILLRAIPRVLPRWFDPAAASGLDATFELRLRNPAATEHDVFAVRISEQRCTVGEGPARDPGAVVTICAEDAIRVASGGVGWPELMSSGRLMLTGDPFLALRFPNIFRLASAAW